MYKVKSTTLPNGQVIVPARERIIFLKEEGIDYDIQTSHELIGDRLVCTAVLTIYTYDRAGEKMRMFSGTSAAILTEKGDFEYETTETKAIGRACAAFGIGIEDSYASAEEIGDALKANADKITPRDPQETASVNDSIKADIKRGTDVTDAATKRVTRNGKKSQEEQPKDPEPEPIVDHISADELKDEPIQEGEDKPMFWNMPEPKPVEPAPIKEESSIHNVEKMRSNVKDIEATTEKAKTVIAEKVEEAVIVPDPQPEPQPVEAAKPTPGNKYGIEIPEPNTNGERGWQAIMRMWKDIETGAGIVVEDFKATFHKLYPDLNQWDESEILQKAKTSEINDTLNVCEVSKK